MFCIEITAKPDLDTAQNPVCFFLPLSKSIESKSGKTTCIRGINNACLASKQVIAYISCIYDTQVL